MIERNETCDRHKLIVEQRVYVECRRQIFGCDWWARAYYIFLTTYYIPYYILYYLLYYLLHHIFMYVVIYVVMYLISVLCLTFLCCLTFMCCVWQNIVSGIFIWLSGMPLDPDSSFSVSPNCVSKISLCFQKTAPNTT